MYTRPVLAAKNVGKRFGSRWLFRAIEFELGPGDCLAILGLNGSGKSTLTKLLAGLVPLTEGQIDRPEPQRIGYSAIDLSLYPNLSAHEHLEIAGTLRQCEPRVGTLLAQVGLEADPKLPTSQFSTGMRARLKLALALQPAPAVLLLDEPGASLDDRGRELLDQVIASEKERGAAIVIATNDSRERRWANLELTLGA